MTLAADRLLRVYAVQQSRLSEEARAVLERYVERDKATASRDAVVAFELMR